MNLRKLTLSTPLLLALAGVAVYAQTNCLPPPAGVIGWWPAEGNANDRIGPYPGTLQGAATATNVGRVGQAFAFDGTNAAVDLGSWFNLQSFTLSLWIKEGDTQKTYADILDNNHTASRSWVIQYANTNHTFAWGAAGIGSIPFDLTPGVWQHLAVTVDSNHVARLYLDGSLVSLVNGAGPIPYDGTEFLRLGRWGGGGRFWNGQLDEFTVWNRALSAAEVAAIPAAGTNGICNQVPPDFFVQPANRTVLLGQSAVFSATAVGTQPLLYQWLLAGTNLPGATSASLTLTNVQLSQTGDYQLVVTNAVGAVTSVVAHLGVIVWTNGVFWDGGGDGVSWSDAINWSGNTVPGTNDDVLIAAAAPTTLIYRGTQPTVRSLLNYETLWLRGDNVGNDATLNISGNLTNHGILRLESAWAGYPETLNVSGTLVNAPEGEVQVNGGSGGVRYLNANVINHGVFNIGAGTGLDCGGAGRVFRQESGGINGVGRFTWAGGEFDWVAGPLTGAVFVRSGALDVAATAGASTIYVSGSSTLLGNRSSLATIWVQGNNSYNDAVLTTAEGAVNAGRIRLESYWAGYHSVLNVGGTNFLNLPTGVILASTGSGGPRWISGNFINQGVVDATSYYLDISGTYEAAGGKIVGNGRVVNASLKVTASPAEPTLIDLWGNCTLLTDNLANTELWIHGNNSANNATLNVSGNVTNHGILRLESTWAGYADTLNVSGTLVNAPGGVVQVNDGSGGPRTFNAGVINQGTFNIGAGAILQCNGTGRVFRQESGSVNGAGWLTWADGELDWVAGALTGTVFVRNGSLDVAATAGASTIYVAGNSTLLGNRSPQATIWVQGNNSYNNAVLTTAEGAVNAGILRLESYGAGYQSVLNVGGTNFTNLPTGVVDANSGSGGPRWISGNFINQGLVDATGGYLDIYGTYEAAGGRITGAGRLRSASLKVTASPVEPTMIDLWGTSTLLTGNLTNTILWVHGGGDGHASLTAAGNVTNRGTLLLESTAGGYWETVTIGGTLVNAPEGVIQVNPGTGGGRTLIADVINRGSINIAPGMTLDCNGAGKVFRQEAGAINATNLFTWADGRFDFVGGFLTGSVAVRNGSLDVALTAGASTIIAAENSTLLGNRATNVTVWVEGGLYGHAALTTAEGATNAGTLLLQSINGGYSSVVNVGGSNFVNTATGVIDANSGTGGDRRISGSFINQGLVDATGGYLDVYGTYEAAGGRITGAGRLRSASLKVTASPVEPTMIDLWGNSTLLTDNLTNTVLWVHGGGDGHATLTAAGNVTNRGTLLLESTAGGYSETVTIGGTLVNAPEGVLQVNPGTGGGRVLSTEMVNAGTVNFDYSTSLGRVGANHVNTGGFRVAGVTATITGASFLNQNPGEMSGTGTFNVAGVSYLNQGIVSPGASPGTLSFTGAYAQGADGRLNLELGGLTAGSQYDRLAVSGAATLDGLLSVTLINDFTPALSNVFTVLTCSALNGQFNAFQGLTLFTNLALEPQAYATHLDLQALAATHPPSAPVIMSQPKNLTVIQGETATFRVTANGTQPFAYQWLHNNSELAGATSASLVLGNVQTNQAGLYALRITNAAGAALSSNALLTVRQVTDLIVADVTATNDAIAGQPLVVTWASVNAGSAPAIGPWVETVALSTNASGASPRLLASFNFTNNLLPGQSLVRTQAVILPGGLNGHYFIAVSTDVTNAVPEDVFETNNTSVSAQFVTIRAPDLAVTSITAPAAAQFGQSLSLAWVVQNAGTATASTPWNDRVYLSTFSNSLAGATLLLTAPASGSLVAAASYTNAPNVSIPLNGASTPGAYFLVVFTDADGLFAEPSEADNLRSVPLALTLPPLPDLAVAQVAAPASALAGQSIPVSWAVTNLGLAPAVGVWNETVYLSSDTVPGNADDIPLATFSFTNNLAANASLVRTQTVTLPVVGASGNQWLVVLADALGDTVELSEANNAGVAALPVNLLVSLALSLPVTSVAEDTANPNLNGLVSRNGSLVSAVTVTLTSSDTNALHVPASVQIPAGQVSAAFVATVVHDGLPGANRLVNVHADATGYAAAEESLTVIESDQPALQLTAPGGALTTEGGVLAALISRTGPTNLAVNVVVTTDNPSRLAPPGVLTIPAGAVSTAFTLAAVDDLVLAPDRLYTITATATGHAPASLDATVRDNDAPGLSFALSTTNVSEAAGASAALATLQRSYTNVALLTTDLSVSLDASATNQVVLPPSVDFLPGQSQVTFPVGTLNNALLDGPRTINLEARVLFPSLNTPAAAPVLAPLTITDDEGPSLTLTTTRTTWPEGTNFIVTLTRNTPVTNSLVVALASSQTNTATLPSSVILPEGTNSVTFVANTVNDGVPSGNKSVTLTAGAAGHASGALNLTVTDINLPDLVVTTTAGPATAFTKQIINLSFRIENQGLAGFTNTFKQRVYFSPTPAPNPETLVGEFPFNQGHSTIPPGQWFEQSVAAFVPLEPGDYWVITEADAGNAVTELDKNNNIRVSALPVHVVAQYSATVACLLPGKQAMAGTPVPLHGTVTTADGSSPEGQLVTLHIKVRGTERQIAALARADGTFDVTWRPLGSEAGSYTVAASHPGVTAAPPQESFTLLGAKFDPASLAMKIYAGSSATGLVSVINQGDVPLTSLAATALNVPGNLTVTPVLTTNYLGSLASVSLRVGIAATTTTPASSTITVRVTSAEGVTVNLPVDVTVVPLTPQLVADPASLEVGVARGQQKSAEFNLINVGAAPTGPLTVAIPGISWLSVASTNPLPSLAPGETNKVVLLLTPGTNDPLGAFTGSLTVNGFGAGLAVPFTFRVVGAAVGNLEVTVEDEFTYYAAGAPRVAGATARLLDGYNNNALIAETTSDTNGLASLAGVLEGQYLLRVTAPQHGSRDLPVTISAGLTNKVRLLLPTETVAYRWTVVPTEIPDRYDIIVETTFETVVPFPVVTALKPMIAPVVIPGKVTQTSVTLTNHGLLAAKGVTLRPKSTATYLITPLVTDVGDIPARGSVTIPVMVQIQPGLDATIVAALNAQHSGGPAPRGPKDLSVGFLDECDFPDLEILYFVICGPDGIWHTVEIDLRPLTMLEDLDGCIKSILENAEKGLAGLPGIACDCASTAAAAIGAALGGSGEVPKGIECLCAPIGLDPIGLAKCICIKGDLDPPPGGPGGNAYITPVGFPGGDGHGCAFIPPAGPAPRRTPKDDGGPGICAQVKLRLEQQLVLTRSAFKATLDIENRLADTALSNVLFRIDFFDAQGLPAGSRFGVSVPTLSGLNAVDGTGLLPPLTMGSAQFTLVPSVDAAPAGQTPYTVGGELRYRQGTNDITITLAPVAIHVLPQPRLAVDYFHQRDVFSDDPFTEVVEPSVPYTLAVMLRNTGLGTARDVSISSSQPQIVDNQKGLLIDFQIIGTELFDATGYQELTPSLTANFGELPGGSVKIGRWLLKSSLQGLFIDYSATFRHLDGLGNPNLSLIGSNDVRIHELVHLVKDTRPGADLLPDFLVNDTPTQGGDSLPTAVYLSSGQIEPVNTVQSATPGGVPTNGALQVTLTAPMPGGWAYLRVPDPQGLTGNRLYILAAARRSDGTNLPPENFWQTDRTFIGLGRRPIRENILHLLDHQSTGSYTLTYVPAPGLDLTPPASSVTALPANVFPQFSVQWAGSDNSSGPLKFDLYVSVDNAPFTLWLQGVSQLSAVYPGQLGNSYAFYSVATDSSGNREAAPATPDAFTLASLVNTPPQLTPAAGVAVDEGVTVLLDNAATDADVPAQTLTFSLGSGSPIGAVINPFTGRITWPTTELDGPGTNLVTVIIQDNGVPSLGATGLVQVIVREVNTAPTLTAIASRTINEGQLLSITNHASDTDLPANQLTFSLGGGAPAGATINATNGVFRWLPSNTQGPSTNTLSIIVADNGTPSLTATQQFVVTVRDVLSDVTLAGGFTNVLAGESGTVPLVLNSSLEITNLAFVVTGNDLRLTNLTVQAASPEVLAASLLPLGSNRYAASLRLDPALAPASTRPLITLGFLAPTNRGSAIIPLAFSQLTAVRSNRQTVAKVAATDAHVVVVEREPVLLMIRSQPPALRLFGLPGTHYALLTASNLTPVVAWQEWTRFLLGGRSTNLANLGAPVPVRFFRAVEVPDLTPVLGLRVQGGNVFALTLTGTPGTDYTVESTVALGAAWTNLFSLTATNPPPIRLWTNDGPWPRFFRARTTAP